jgi:hypothetical protein
MLDEWRSLGQDPNSLIAAPTFVDREAHDHRLLPESPAFDIGFEPINIDEVGPRPN